MDSGIMVALVLAAIFFGAITWLVIHARRQERQAVGARRQAPPEVRRPESFDSSTRPASLRVGAGVGERGGSPSRSNIR
jgi:hypothetical protein